MAIIVGSVVAGKSSQCTNCPHEPSRKMADAEAGEGEERKESGECSGGGGDGEGGEGDCDPLVRAGGGERLDFEDLLDEVGVGAYQVCDAAAHPAHARRTHAHPMLTWQHLISNFLTPQLIVSPNSLSHPPPTPTNPPNSLPPCSGVMCHHVVLCFYPCNVPCVTTSWSREPNRYHSSDAAAITHVTQFWCTVGRHADLRTSQCDGCDRDHVAVLHFPHD